MNSTNEAAANAVAHAHHAVNTVWNGANRAGHVALIIGMAIAVHVTVRFIRYFSDLVITKSYEKKNPLGFVTQQPKFVTLSKLIVSTLTFTTYAVAIYVIVALEFPNQTTLKTYLGSAAVVGLALSFGMQGLIQDVITGITLILSDTMDVGDTVDLMNGVIGRVERIGLRFTKVINFYNQQIYVPNRNIMNVSRFPHRGILVYSDIQIPGNADPLAVTETIRNVARGVWNQFGAIILDEPVFGKIQGTPGNWTFLRVQFKIWPGQDAIITSTFRSQMVNAMKKFDAAYSDWQVVVTYRAIT